MFVQFAREMGDQIMNGMTASEFRDLKEKIQPEDMKLFIAEECLYKVCYIHYLTIVSVSFNRA